MTELSVEVRRARARLALLYVGVLILALLLVYRLRAVLTPILLAFLIAYAADPIVDRLEKRRVPRSIGAVLVLVAILGAGALFLVLLVPALAAEIAAFAATLPALIERALSDLEPWVRSNFGFELPHTFKEAMDRWGSDVQAIAPRIAGSAGGLLGGAIGGVLSLLGMLLQAIVVPVFAYYLLVDFDRNVARVRVLVPPRHRPTVFRITGEIDRTMSGFFRGQLTVMLVQGVLYAIGLALLGVPLGIGIGLLTGLLVFVPYIGVGTGFVLAIVLALLDFQGWGTIAGVVVLYVALNVLDGLFITPRILGGKVGLGPLAVIVGLMTCGELFGFLGVLLAVPLAAIAKILVHEGLISYMRSDVFGTPQERDSAKDELAAIEGPPPSPAPQPEPVIPEPESLDVPPPPPPPPPPPLPTEDKS